MSGEILASHALPSAHWRRISAGLAMLAGLAVLAILFHAEAQAAVRVWTESTAYSHCFFVLPIALWMAWDRREVFDGLEIQPLPRAALLAIPIGLVWFAADRLGIMEGRQLAAIAAVELLFLSVLGWRFCKAMLAPLLYLIFLVPFGAFLTPFLQNFTTDFVDIGLDLLGIPHYVDAYTIDIPAGTFLIAEACAGLRFLIASIAFGALYACLIYRSPTKRALFILASIIIPIIANGFRALGIVTLGEVLGSAEAAATDHVLYGWIFFSIVILILIAAGLPFREDTPPAGRKNGLSNPFAGLLPAGLNPFVALLPFAVLTLLAPGAAALLDRAAPHVPPEALAGFFATPPGCTTITNAPSLSPLPGGATQAFSCDGVPLVALVQPFSAHATTTAIFALQRDATGEGVAEEADHFQIAAGPLHWRGIDAMEPNRITASVIWIDGAPSLGGLRARLTQARNSLLGGAHAPVLVLVTAPLEYGEPSDRKQARETLAAFLKYQQGLSEKVEALARRAAQS